MESELNIATALDEAFRIIDQLVEFCDVRGLGGEKPVEEARDFAERLMRFARYRRCCHNCAHCRPDDGALHVGKTEDPMVCYGDPDWPTGIYVMGDLGAQGTNCGKYSCKYEGGRNDD